MVPAIMNQRGAVQTAHLAGFLRMWTTTLMSMKMVAPKPAAMTGAIPRPAKMAPRPFPLFHPHCTLLALLEVRIGRSRMEME